MGVSRDATPEQVKQAYRKLARKFHPDVSKEKDAEARFKEVGEAYEVLRDPEKRAAYDQLGKGPPPGESFQPPPDWGSGFEFRGAGHAGPGEEGSAAFDGDASAFFESLFGRSGMGGARGGFGRSRRRRDRGEDHHARVTVDLEASLEGGTRALTLSVPAVGEDGRAADAATHAQCEDSARHPGRPAHTAGRPGRDTARRNERQATCSWKWVSRRIRSIVRKDAISISTCRWRRGRQRWAPACRCPRPVAPWSSRFPRVRRPARNCVCADVACRPRSLAICMQCCRWSCRLPTAMPHEPRIQHLPRLPPSIRVLHSESDHAPGISRAHRPDTGRAE